MIYALDVQTTGSAVKVRGELIARYPGARVEVVGGFAERKVKLWTIDATFYARQQVLRDVHRTLDALEPAPAQLSFANEAFR